LRRKEFYIFNEKYSKEEYETKVKEFAKLSFVEMTEEFEKFFIKQPHVFAQQFNNENFVGDHVYNCKNVYGCYDVNELEDCMYATNSLHSKDCADSNFFAWSELLYQCHSGVTLYNSNFCDTCWYSQNLEYCEYVFNSHDCFGCVSLNHAQFCILNKQYSESEYKKLIEEIKKEMKNSGEYGKMFDSQYLEYLAVV